MSEENLNEKVVPTIRQVIPDMEKEKREGRDRLSKEIDEKMGKVLEATKKEFNERVKTIIIVAYEDKELGGDLRGASMNMNPMEFIGALEVVSGQKKKSLGL